MLERQRTGKHSSDYRPGGRPDVDDVREHRADRAAAASGDQNVDRAGATATGLAVLPGPPQ